MAMNAKLTQEEIAELSRFRYSVQEKTNHGVNMGSLLEEGKMLAFLEDVSREFQAPDLTVAASVFSKRFAFVPAIFLYALSAWDKKLLLSLDQLWIQSSEKDGNWLPEYYFKKLKAEKFAGGDREAWRDEAIQLLFKDCVYPILDELSKQANLSKYILWENISVYIFWIYGNILEQTKAHSGDFDYIVNKAPGYLFGPFTRNPLQRFYTEPVYLEEVNDYVRVRKTCCFNYQLGEKRTYCNTCPLYCRQFNTGKKNRD
jgi:ferric iron reductase protein FhuF